MLHKNKLLTKEGSVYIIGSIVKPSEFMDKQRRMDYRYDNLPEEMQDSYNNFVPKNNTGLQVDEAKRDEVLREIQKISCANSFKSFQSSWQIFQLKS